MGKRESLAIGLAMNSRGAMEIILGLLALDAKIINEPMFVALVVMALVTSLMSGPLIKRVLRLEQRRHLADYLSAKTFAGWLRATDRRTAICELTEATCKGAGLGFDSTLAAVLNREEIMPTGIGNGVAIPHARVEGIAAPIVGVGLSGSGIDFDAPDGEPAHLLFLILTPPEDDGAQLKILAEIARTFIKPEARQQAIRSGNYTEFLAGLKTVAT
jgi:mannitol/fructose-specific phosphotransferase system IIA component (Ntr-type)